MLVSLSTFFLALGPSLAQAADPCTALARGDSSARDTCVALSIKNLSDAQMSQWAIQLLNGIGEPAVPGLTKALESADALTRAGAADALGRIGKRGARTEVVVAALVARLKDKDAAVRRQSAGAIGRITLDAAGASAALQKSLQDEDTQVRAAASDALGKIGKPDPRQ